MRKVSILLLVLVFAGFATAQPVGLIVAYDFEDPDINANQSAPDVSGLAPAVPAALVAGSAVIPDAVRGSKVLHSSANGYGAIAPFDPKFNFQPTMTMQAWYAADAESAWEALAGFSGNGARMFHHFGAGMLGAIWLDNPFDSWNPVNAGPGAPYDPNNGEWHHVLMTWDGDWLYGYYDGDLVTASIIDRDGTSISELPNDFSMIGLDGANNPFFGSVDDVAVWKGYAPPESVVGLYNGTYSIYDVPLLEGPFWHVPSCEEGPVSESNLVGWWHFEEGAGAATTADLAPNPAPDATLQNDAAISFDADTIYDDAPWQHGWALDIPVVADPNDPNTMAQYVDLGAPAKLDDPNLWDFGFTISTWVYPVGTFDDTDPAYRWVVKMGGDVGPRFNIHAGGIRFFMSFVDEVTADNFSSVQGGWGTITPDKWYHIALVYSPDHPANFDRNDDTTWGFGFGSKMEAYINGSLAAEIGGQKGPINFPEGLNFTIGNPDIGPRYQGKIDDVRVYDVPLTKEEIKCVMNRHCLSSIVPGDFANGDCNVNLVDFSVKE